MYACFTTIKKNTFDLTQYNTFILLRKEELKQKKYSCRITYSH